MTRTRTVVLVIGSALFAACGGDSTGGPDATPGGPDAKGNGNPDAALPGGVAAIPLTSPDGTFYAANVAVGAQSFAMIVDTGSSTTAVAGSSCSGCAVSPKYAPGSTATDQHQSANAQYGSGSWNGEIFKDMVGLGSSTPAVPVKIASITSQQTFFDGNQNSFQGLLGMGGDGLLTQGTTSYFDQIVAGGTADIQAYELCDGGGGTMWLGGYDPAATASAPQYTPIDQQFPYYAVQLQDMKLGTTSIGFTSSTAITDTGTTLFYVPKAAASGVLAQCNKATTLFATQFTSQQGVYCAMAKSGVGATQIDAAMPPLVMTFPGSGGSFTVSAPATRSYLFDAGGGMWCIGVADNSQLGFNITLMGDMGLRGFVHVVDRANNRIGFAPAQGCTTNFRQRTTSTPLRERGRIPTL